MNIWVSMLLISLTSLLNYKKTLNMGLVSDDLLTVKKTEPIAKDKIEWLWNEFRLYRITPNTVNKKKESKIISEPKFTLQHSINLTLHTINCILIYLLFRKFGGQNVGLTTSILFCLNPITCQGGSVWISGRGYALSTMFVLLMMCLPVYSPFFLWLATLCSSNSLFSPMLFIGTKHYYLALLLPLALYFYKHVINKVKENKRGNSKASSFTFNKLVLAIKTYGFYFRNAILPYNLSLYPSVTWGYGIGEGYDKKALSMDKEFWIGLFICLGVISSLIFNYGEFSYGLWWFSISIMMYCNFVTIQQGIAHRYAYLATIGLMYSLANLIYSLPQPYSIYSFIALSTIYSMRLWLYLPYWRNEYWYQEMNTIEDSKTPYSWVAKGISKALTNNFVGAIYDFREAVNQAKDNYDMHEFKAHLNLANMFYCLGDIENAKKEINTCRDCMYDVDDKQQQLDMINNIHNLIIKTEQTNVIDIKGIKLWK